MNYDFKYLGKKYKWIKDYQGIIDCPCNCCQSYVKSLIKNGRLKEVV